MGKNDVRVCEECQQPIQRGEHYVVVVWDRRGTASEFAHLKCGLEQETVRYSLRLLADPVPMPS